MVSYHPPTYQTSVVLPIYQAHDYLDDSVLLFWLALGNQESQCHQCIVRQALASVGTVQDSVHTQIVDKDSSGNPFVAVAECVVFDDEAQEVGPLLFYAGVRLLAVKGLVNRPSLLTTEDSSVVASDCNSPSL
jgi:hypothetical protein